MSNTQNEHDPATIRKVYYDAWQKALQHEPLTPMENLIVDIIQRHPEYHEIFSARTFEIFQSEKFELDHNPFFHLSLHVALLEQVSIDKPPGIKQHFLRLMGKYQDQTLVEHKMMDCLARILVENFQKPQDNHEMRYLESIARIS
jgi:hypothetical protein